MNERKYYEAYDERYRQVHERGLQWFDDDPSPIVAEVMEHYGIGKSASILEIGCGEGRDAVALLSRGFAVRATDISQNAIEYCRSRFAQYAQSFSRLDCLSESLEERFDFIYAVAVVHMLTEDSDREKFYSFVRTHLAANGIALICTMGDGEYERRTDPATAFDNQQRVHEQTGESVCIASTSCRMISFAFFEEELRRSRLRVLQKGINTTTPGFTHMMYAVVARA